MGGRTHAHLHELEAETASGNGGEQYIGVSVKGVVYFVVTAVSGTSPTLDVVLQAKCPETGVWIPYQTLTQATGVSAERVNFANISDEVIRAVWTIGGTATPTFTFAVTHISGKQ